MRHFARKASSLVLGALVLSLSIGVPQANSQGLFDRLFGGGIKKTKKTDFPPPPKQRKKNSGGAGGGVAIAKISAPSYYTYKADGLRRVDFSLLASTAQSASWTLSLSALRSVRRLPASTVTNSWPRPMSRRL